MVTPPDIEAQILRFYHAEKWTMGTIARQLHIHHSVVRRVLAQAGLPRVGPPPRPSQIDAYLPFIRQTLERFPTLTASRLYVMAYGRGYRGSPDQLPPPDRLPPTAPESRGPIYVCAACPASKHKSTGVTSDISKLVGHAAR